jgi:hypothetical protein
MRKTEISFRNVRVVVVFTEVSEVDIGIGMMLLW